MSVEVNGDRVTLNITIPTTSKLVFDERVQEILGVSMPDYIQANQPTTILGKENIVWDIGCRKIYVYTDIIENQRVGDQVAPLLRITDYSGIQDRIEIKDFNHLQYIRLRHDDIESIRIYIKTETGEDLPLTFGTVTCTLHFREKRF